MAFWELKFSSIFWRAGKFKFLEFCSEYDNFIFFVIFEKHKNYKKENFSYLAVNKNPYYCKKLCPFLGKRLRGLSAYCTMYNNCKEKEVFSSAIFHKHCLKSGQINYHEKELVFFFAAALVAISKQLFKCQSKLLLNFRPSFFSGLDLFFL